MLKPQSVTRQLRLIKKGLSITHRIESEFQTRQISNIMTILLHLPGLSMTWQLIEFDW